MCGIMGYYCFGEVRPDKQKIGKMFSLLSKRGTDASGFAFINKEQQLIVTKLPVRSSSLLKTKRWKQITLPKTMIFHTRAKTQGEPTNNMNNHPLFTKTGLCIVHNGHIFNDADIFKDNRIRDGEVDSEAILSLLHHTPPKERIAALFNDLVGAFAIAIIETQNPTTLTLVKNGNPIELFYNTTDDILYFCSERSIMEKGLDITKKNKRGFSHYPNGYESYQMKDKTSMLITETGVTDYKEYEAKPTVTEDWYDDPDYDYVECPWCYELTDYDDQRLINYCIYCGRAITENELYP